jgi:hypothetical protein
LQIFFDVVQSKRHCAWHGFSMTLGHIMPNVRRFDRSMHNLLGYEEICNNSGEMWQTHVKTKNETPR